MQAGECCKCEPERARSTSFSSASTTNSTNSENRGHSECCLFAAPYSRRFSLAFAAMLLLAICPTLLGALPRVHRQKGRVRFLATSTLYRTTWGMNEDIYLVDLTFPKSGQPALARLINEYSNWAPPIPASVLKSDDGVLFNLIRDPGCDIPYGEMVLRTAPGDPLAIVRERLVYHPRLKKMPEPGEVLPCYRTVEHKKGLLGRLVGAIVLWK